MHYKAFGKTHTGKIRATNEDYYLLNDDMGIYIICDGVGGPPEEAVASQLAAETVMTDLCAHNDVITRYAMDPSPENRRVMTGLCRSAIQAACRKVYDARRTIPRQRGMSTTCAMLVLAGSHALLAHVGDSRAYLIRSGRAWQMTEDHSFGLEQFHLDMGTDLVPQDINSPVTRFLGQYPSVEVDILDVELMSGDRFILCSDGLGDYLTPRTLLKLADQVEADKLPAKLLRMANRKGGKDNSTCIVIDLEDVGMVEGQMNAMEKIKALRQIPFFESLGFLELVKVLNLLHMRRIAKGDSVIRKDEAGLLFYVMMDGAAEVKCGRKRIACLGPGDFFDETHFADGTSGKGKLKIVTTERTSVLAIRKADFNSLMFDQLQLSQKVLVSFCQVLSSRKR